MSNNTIDDTFIDVKNINDAKRKRYYDEWKASGLKTAEFCRKNQLPLKSFRYWCKQYPKTKENKGFAPVALTPKITQTLNDLSLNIGMRLPNQIQFQLNLSVKQFVELLRGINDGIATIR